MAKFHPNTKGKLSIGHSYIIFAKYPKAGKVKTRLAKDIGAEKACALYSAMLRDALRRIARRNYPMLLCVHPADDTQRFEAWLQAHDIRIPQLSVVPQHGDTLGDKMHRAFVLAGERGMLPASIIGSDSPAIPDQSFDIAEQSLSEDSDCALIGKTEDGGFYLMALPRVHPDYFFGADYSNESVFERSFAGLQKKFARVVHLPECYDVDTLDALYRLRSEAYGSEAQRFWPETARLVLQMELAGKDAQ